MKMRFAGWILILAALLPFGLASAAPRPAAQGKRPATARPATARPEAVRPATVRPADTAVRRGTPAGPVVNPGAVLDIAVYAAGEKELEFTATVAPDSTIMVPLAGTTRVGGFEPAIVAQRLQNVLGEGYFVNPQVLVNVRDYGGRILVSGEVQKPGIYPMGQGLSALSAVVLAGGFTDFASAGKAKVVRMRNGRTEVLKVDLGKVLKGESQDFALRDGDRVEVPRRLF